MKEKILIFDTTLRDGDQSSHAFFSQEGKIIIAEQLDKIGVDIIEAGFPISSEEEFETIEKISKKVKGSIVSVMARAVTKDIVSCHESTKKAKRRRINLLIPVSDQHISKKLNTTKKEIIEMITKSITEAQQYFEDIQFTAEDSTRADKKFLIEIISTVVKLGVKTISLPDTVGCMTPEEYYNLISFIKKNVKGNYILSCHCHNDLGLATANTFFGITAGAQQVEVCVNGIGERAGNCPLEEIVMLLHLKTNYRTDIKTKLLFKTSKLVSKESTMIMQTNKAIVGEKIFSHKSGIHQHGILIEPSMYEIIDFKSVGRQKREIVIGKHSGEFAKKASIQKKYQRTNIFTYL